jgi:orotidine-5'-phosphate decarboxylase
LRVGDAYLYEKVIEKANEWNEHKNVGIVVGATQADELASIRRRVPDMPILLPGVGAQGGDLQSSVKYGCTADGDMLIINVGRSILYAGRQKKDFIEKVRQAAQNVNEEIRAASA